MVENGIEIEGKNWGRNTSLCYVLSQERAKFEYNIDVPRNDILIKLALRHWLKKIKLNSKSCNGFPVLIKLFTYLERHI